MPRVRRRREIGREQLVHYGAHDGRGYEHCFSGNDGLPNSLGRLTINSRVIPQMTARMAATAPADADLRWRSY